MSFGRFIRLAACILSVSFMSVAAEAALTHTTHNLNLRSGPDTTYPPISIIPAGAAIDVMGCGAVWCHIHWAGHLGYVNGDYLLTHVTVVVAPLAHVEVHHVVHHHVVAHQQCKYLFC